MPLKPERASLRDDLAAALWPRDPDAATTWFAQTLLDDLEAAIGEHFSQRSP